MTLKGVFTGNLTGNPSGRVGGRQAMLHILALCLISAMAVGTLLATHRLIENNTASYRLVGLAERQRMLAHRISLIEHEMRLETDAARIEGMRLDLGAARDLMIYTHNALIRGSALLDIAEPSSGMVRAIFLEPGTGLDARMEAFAAEATAILDTGPAMAAEARLARDLAREELIYALDRLVRQYKTDARDALTEMRRIEIGGFTLVLALILMQGIFVVRPLVQRLRINEGLLTRANEEIRDGSLRDRLTELPNRRYLDEYLERLMAQAARSRARVGVLAIDLDGFRAQNDRLGRVRGDKLLRAAAFRLKRLLRTSDFLARTGGDEFVAICPEANDPVAMAALAERIVAEMAAPADIDGERLGLSCSVGVSISEHGDTDPGRLVSEADIALYDAKMRGPGSVEFFADAARAQVARRREIAAALEAALEAGQIEPFFQPQISARTGEIVGFEALARWCHPEKGVLPPGYFLDVARQSGLGDRLAQTIVRKALATLTVWRRQGFEVPRVSLNFSVEEVRDAERVERLLWDVERAGLVPADVAVELAESALIRDEGDPVIANIDRLVATGFAIEIDDFGTGKAPIANLHRFRVSRIKIDRSFISGIHTSAEREALARVMIELASNLGIGSVAEGVETAEEWRRLSQIGCEVLQGYGIGKPMTGEECADWMSTYRGRRALGPRQAASA